MSHDRGRKGFYDRDRDIRDYRSSDYRSGRIIDSGRGIPRKRSRSLTRSDLSKRRSRSPRKNDKDMIDDNILSEISKLPEPSELWDSNNQFQDGGYVTAPPPPSFSQEPTQNYGTSNYPTPYSGIYDDFPPLASAPQHPPDMGSWNQMALPPPPVPVYHNPEDQLKKEAAIESEMRHQKAALSKQREDYIKKATILKKELDTLKDQRNELRGDAKRSPSPDTKRFLKENTKLQLEIQNKLKTINNVVDMLNGIIGEEAQEMPESDDSPERKRKSRSPSNKKFNYVYYDPEMHWCRVCNEFPPTAKDYLNHLHSVAHHKMAAQHMEAPWHTVSGVNEGFPSVPSAPTKRTPIRGLQFFVPSTAWYCKLCDQFIGDLHCASAHLKSIVHSKNYTNFVEQNPHWETDWMSDRQKAFEKARAGNKLKAIEDKPSQPYTAHTITFSKDGFHTKRPKKSPTPQLEEKKKKKDKKKKSKRKRDSSTSSSSQTESSDSEAAKKKKVKGADLPLLELTAPPREGEGRGGAPRKKKKKKSKNSDRQLTDRQTKKAKRLANIDVTDDKALQQWMANINSERLSETDRKLLDSLKTRIKKERDDKQRSDSRDIERVTEMQRKIRENERRSSRSREIRDERRESRESRKRRDESRDRRDNSRDRRGESRERHDDRWDRRDKREELQDKKPEIRKMPFIGKMPVYKHLGKTKAEELKKEEQKKKEDTDNSEKKRQELDAEIQRKVAAFKEKIAMAQLEQGSIARRQQAELPPPALALPAALGSAMPPVLIPPPAPQPPPPPAPAPNQPALAKDFQEALDIIFPTDAKSCNEKLQHDLYNAMQQPGILGVPPGLGMPPGFPGLGLMQPPGMYGFDLNAAAGMYPQPQLYDSHVPLMPPNQQKRQNKNSRMNKKNHIKQEHGPVKTEPGMHRPKDFAAAKNAAVAKNMAAAAKKKEELDDLAMLGIDATDVGAGGI